MCYNIFVESLRWKKTSVETMENDGSAVLQDLGRLYVHSPVLPKFY